MWMHIRGITFPCLSRTSSIWDIAGAPICSPPHRESAAHVVDPIKKMQLLSTCDSPPSIHQLIESRPPPALAPSEHELLLSSLPRRQRLWSVCRVPKNRGSSRRTAEGDMQQKKKTWGGGKAPSNLITIYYKSIICHFLLKRPRQHAALITHLRVQPTHLQRSRIRCREDNACSKHANTSHLPITTYLSLPASSQPRTNNPRYPPDPVRIDIKQPQSQDISKATLLLKASSDIQATFDIVAAWQDALSINTESNNPNTNVTNTLKHHNLKSNQQT